MRKYLWIVCGVFVLTAAIAVAVRNGWLHPNTPELPGELVKKLVALRNSLAQEATKSEHMTEDTETFGNHLDMLKSAVGSSSSVFVPLIVDGLRIQNGLVRAEVLLNTAGFLQLELIADGIVAGDGYSALDNRLLKLENSFADRDEACDRLMNQEKLVAQQMEAVQTESQTKAAQEVASLLRAAVNANSIAADQAIAAYREQIKPATEVLREIVDKLAKRAAGVSGAEPSTPQDLEASTVVLLSTQELPANTSELVSNWKRQGSGVARKFEVVSETTVAAIDRELNRIVERLQEKEIKELTQSGLDSWGASLRMPSLLSRLATEWR